MTNDEKIKRLEGYRYISREISLLQAQLSETRQIARVEGNTGLAGAEDALQNDIDMYIDQRIRIELAVKRLDDPELRHILRLRYMNTYEMSYETIAQNIKKSRNFVMEAHQRAVEGLEL